jgi:hypothetical protein
MTKWKQCVSGCLLFGCSAWAMGQADFQGSVNMTITSRQGQPMPFVYKVKGSMIRVEMQMGARSVSVIMDLAAHKQMVLLPEMQSYMVHDFDPAHAAQQAGESSPPKITDLHTTDTVVGHTCENYQVTGEKFSATMCAAKDLPGGLFGSGPAARNLYGLGALKTYGMPLKIVTAPSGEGAGLPMTMEVTKIDPGKLDDALFKVPAGWHELQGGVGAATEGGNPPQ